MEKYITYTYPYQRPVELNQLLSTTRLLMVALIEGEEIEVDRQFMIELKRMVSTIEELLPEEKPDWVCQAVVA